MIRISSREARVSLDGAVPSREQSRMAETDAWYVFGVEDVTNRLEVRPPPR